MNLERLTRIAAQLCADNNWGEPEYIDNGASAAVYKIKTANGLEALKIYDPDFSEGESALIQSKRIELQRALIGHECDNLIEVYDTGQAPNANTWYLRMEFCPWQSLERRLADVPDDKVHHLLKQLILAVKYLDGKNLVHRDIKPANIVVSDDFNHLKLLDFGVLRHVALEEGSGTEIHQFIATAQYSPPEFLSRDEEPGADGFDAINLYQIGAVLHDLITKTAIFAEEKATKNKFKLYKAVTEKIPRVVSAGVPPRLIALCIAALEKNPAKRISSVRLDDFLANADDIEALRRRITSNAQNRSNVARPTLAAWHPKVRVWGRAAGRMEADTLGAIEMNQSKMRDGYRWTLSFERTPASIYLDLVQVEEMLAVYVLSSSGAKHDTPSLFISADGPSLPESGIPGALAAQYLFAIDTALTHTTTPAEESL